MEKRLSHFLILTSLIFLFSNCNKEDAPVPEPPDDTQNPCAEYADLGQFSLLESSKAFLPYPDNIQKVIFSDSLGNEFVGQVTVYKTVFTNVVIAQNRICPFDSTQSLRFHWEKEGKYIGIIFEELDLSLAVNIDVTLSGTDYSQKMHADFCFVTLNSPLSGTTLSTNLLLVLAPKNHPTYQGAVNETLETYTIHGIEFQDVINKSTLPGPEPGEFEIFYSAEIGFVGFRERDGDLSLKFERTE